MDNIYYISLDQASDKTGICIWKNGMYVSHSLINENHIDNIIGERSRAMFNDIVILLQKYKPMSITLEDTALQCNPKSFKDLTRLQGAIIGYCLCNDVDYSIYSPSQWRKIIGISGGKGTKRPEFKERAIKYVKDNLGIDASEDEAEAICIGIAHLKTFGITNFMEN